MPVDPLPDPASLSSQAEAVFAEYQHRKDAGEAVEFDALCDANTDIAAELRALKSHWDAVVALCQRTGLDPSSNASISDALRAKYGPDVDPGVSLDGASPKSGTGPTSGLLKRLQEHGPKSTRYKILGEVARGGMGAILRVWDADLRRTLAMKVVLGKENAGAASDTPMIEPKTLGRFLEEAQVTGQLDHPGIVPVHELGLASDGRVYFTMRLVKGEDLKHVFDLVHTGKEGWNETRALGVLLKVCEAMSYAHDKGVVHRDLKPANVMVGKYGEVYVMDWGLARVVGRADRHDIRIKPDAPSTMGSVRTERREERDETPDSPLVTMDGEIMGTPAYMPPEQAQARVDELGAWSDVYSLGAMMYHLLAHQMPFVPKGARMSQRMVLMRLIDGPPKALHEVAPQVPAELTAIIEKAMKRDPAHRYSNTQDLGADLRAFLEGRVVKAYETGTWAETKKLLRRNSALAMSLAVAALITITGVVWVSIKNAEVVAANTKLAAGDRESRLRALIPDLAYFETLDDDVDYARHQTRPAADWWLERAHQLVDGVEEDADKGTAWNPGLHDVEEELTKLGAKALERTPDEIWNDTWAGMTPGESEPIPVKRRTWHFVDSRAEWWHKELVTLFNGLRLLSKKIEFSERSVRNQETAELWSAAIIAISASEKYRGAKWPCGDHLTPQMGLVPIGPDPESGLWEFAHLGTGRVARRGADKRLVLEPEMGLVLVLLPGGRVPVAESDSEQDEWLPQVDLDPFFLSKYEMMYGQWERIGGWMQMRAPVPPPTLTPACDLSWEDCALPLPRAGWLQLPTMAQWEYGCRAGTTTKWWPGNAERDLHEVANLRFDEKSDVQINDIGQLRGNKFGLHDVHGNVWEWCRGSYIHNNAMELRAGDGFDDQAPLHRVCRGGAADDTAESACSSHLLLISPANRSSGFGLRPARAITP